MIGIEELRDTHRLESASQSDQLEKLRRQPRRGRSIDQSVPKLVIPHRRSRRSKREIDMLRAEVKRANGIAKEEEEKRVKAISLLKTVRQKLVKAEKDKRML